MPNRQAPASEFFETIINEIYGQISMDSYYGRTIIVRTIGLDAVFDATSLESLVSFGVTVNWTITYSISGNVATVVIIHS